MNESDRILRQLERDAIAACAAMTVAAWALSGGRGDMAAGVLGGGALTAWSYRAIKNGVEAVMRTEPAVAAGDEGRQAEGAPTAPTAAASAVEQPGEGAGVAPLTPAISRGQRLFAGVKFFTRYALLAVGAYVMLTRFRLHPVGLLVGATTPFVAALVQVARMARAGAPAGKHPF